MTKRVMLLVALTCASGCDIFENRACTLELRQSVVVLAVDSVNGAAVTDGLRGFVREGSFQEDLAIHPAAPSTLFFHQDYERAGVYDVGVFANGYRDWTMRNVRVEEDDCHVRPRVLTARLVRQM